MTKFQTILAAVISAIVAGALYKFVPDMKEIAAGFGGLTLLLLGYAKQHPEDAAAIRQASKSSGVVGILLGLSLGGLTFGGTACHNVTPDQFFNSAVDCAKVNPNSSAALAQVEACLVAAMSGNPAACLGGLITEAHFTVDEVACVVAYLGQQANAKVGNGTADAPDLVIRRNANQWLSQEHISIQNSYQGQK